MNKKILGVAAISLALVCANAEDSGAFVGLGLGFGGATIKNTGDDEKIKVTTDMGVDVEVVGGYKVFFNDYIGIRTYGSFAYGANKIKKVYMGPVSAKVPNGERTSINTYEINANIDFLANFVSVEYFDFGAYAGIGLGVLMANDDGKIGIGLGGGGGKPALITDFNETKKLTKAGFNTTINIGLRSVIAQHHGIEVGARIPLVPLTIMKDEEGVGIGKIRLHKDYAVNFKYIFSF